MLRTLVRIASITALTTGIASCGSAGEGQRTGADPLSVSYVIDGDRILLTNGRHEMPAAPGSAIRVVTEVAGEVVRGDLDGDGDEDAILFLRHDPGGSGTFYYLAAALREDDGLIGTSTVLLGDRIVPTKIVIRDGEVTASFLDRPADASMAEPPTVSRSRRFTLGDEGWVDLDANGQIQ